MNKTYKLERNGKTAYVVLRDALNIFDLVKWGSGARWTVTEVWTSAQKLEAFHGKGVA